MSPRQIARQIKFLLEQQVWTGVGGTSVFGTGVPDSSAVISADHPILRFLGVLRSPYVVIKPSGIDHDDEHPEFLSSIQFSLTVVSVVPNDRTGQGAITGANRTSLVTSVNRGVDEVMEEVFNAVGQADPQLGLNLRATAVVETDTGVSEDDLSVAWREMRVVAVGTTAPFYHPARRLAATNLGGGQASLSWTLPPARYDRRRVRLRRVAGATPPATIDDGAEVVLGTNLPITFTDTPGAGVFSYSIFGVYDERGVGADEFYSARASVTVTVGA